MRKTRLGPAGTYALQAAGAFATSDGTFVYAGGGLDESFAVHNDLLRYDPVANSWTSLAPSPDYYFAAPAVYSNGKIYILAALMQRSNLPTRLGFMI